MFTGERKKSAIIASCLAILFAAMTICGITLDQGDSNLIGGYLAGSVLALAVPFFGVIFWITQKINCYNFQKNQLLKMELIKWYLIVVLVWGMGYLAMFPGVYATDAPYWYYEFSRTDIPISSQWSPVYAGAFYCFVEFGRRFLGSAVIGFGIFTFIQMSMVLYGVWKIAFFLNEKLGKYAAITSVIFFAIVPIHNILAVTSAQDSLFALSFAMCLMHLIDIAMDAPRFFLGWRKQMSLMFWLTCSCIIRNNGLYAVLVLVVFVTIFLHKCKGKLLLILLSIITLIVLYQGPVFSLMGIQKGTAIREMLSLPLQQMGFSYNYTDDISPDLKIEMQRYLSDEDWMFYQQCISDQLKGRLKITEVQEDFSGFVKLYLKVGGRSPSGYLMGTLYQTYGLWYPFKNYPDSRIWHPYMFYVPISGNLYESGLVIPRESLFPVYDKMLGWLFGVGESQDGYGGNLFMTFSEIPVWSLLCKAGTYTWLIMYAFVYFIVYRRWQALIPLGYVLGLFLTVFLSPVILYRYVAPLVFSSPLIVALLFLQIAKYRNNKKVF